MVETIIAESIRPGLYVATGPRSEFRQVIEGPITRDGVTGYLVSGGDLVRVTEGQTLYVLNEEREEFDHYFNNVWS